MLELSSGKLSSIRLWINRQTRNRACFYILKFRLWTHDNWTKFAEEVLDEIVREIFCTKNSNVVAGKWSKLGYVRILAMLTLELAACLVKNQINRFEYPTDEIPDPHTFRILHTKSCNAGCCKAMKKNKRSMIDRMRGWNAFVTHNNFFVAAHKYAKDRREESREDSRSQTDANDTCKSQSESTESSKGQRKCSPRRTVSNDFAHARGSHCRVSNCVTHAIATGEDFRLSTSAVAGK